MQGINLAQRPFVNRRPVFRLAILLWLIGVGLAIHNVRQYTGHWLGTSAGRESFADLARQVGEERKALDEVKRGLGRVSLSRENRHTAFLNQLIAFRTFPWSALFDDLEEVVPLNVKLLSVQPKVELKAAPEKKRRQQRRRRPRPAAATNSQSTDSTGSGDTSAPDQDEQVLRRDEVQLQLNGIAKNEEAVVEFIQELYADPSFRAPFLPGETFHPDGTVSFTLSTIYLTGRREKAPAASGEGEAEAEVIATVATETDGSESSQGTELEAAEQEATELESEPTELANSGEPSSARRPGNVGSRGSSSGERGLASRDSTERGQAVRDSTEREARRGQPAMPRSRIRSRALPGSRSRSARPLPGAGSPGTADTPSASGAPDSGSFGSLPPVPGNSGFVDPPASAPPQLRGSVLNGRSAA